MLDIKYIIKDFHDVLIINGETIVSDEDNDRLDGEDMLEILTHHLSKKGVDLNIDIEYAD